MNPDFVPLAHELVLHLAAGPTRRQCRPARRADRVRPRGRGRRPRGRPSRCSRPTARRCACPAARSGESARVRYADTAEPGVYRLTFPNPPGGFAYALVAPDPREADPAPLDPAEAARLAEGWPLAFEPDPAALPARIASGDASPRREVWRCWSSRPWAASASRSG